MLAAVRQNGDAMRYTGSERLLDDRDVVMAAVQQNGLALGWASERLRDDPAVVRAAVRQNGDAVRYASERLRGANATRDYQ